MNNSELLNSVAIIGLSCRFPGAENADQFWENIKNGIESISELTDEELVESGIPKEEFNKPNYVKKVPVLNDIEFFDASFFGYTPREAKIMDPQHRLFLESCWKALEDSGYNPNLYKGLIGVFAGAGNSDYLVLNLSANRDKLPPLEGLEVVLGNDRDHLCTRVAYNLNLKGPAVTVQTACSTSLVAVHLACDSILSGQCDIALAGAASINLPMKKGYKYVEEGIASPDGHTYAFDSRGKGTVFGSGVGVVVLKRLSNAIEDRDNIYAVIRGTAINNDGSAKVGYAAPSVEGQSKVVAEALEVAGINPETISYIETHGTGTALGDPIEIKALTKAFRLYTEKCGYCLIGSVKTNIGHTVAAAGIAGLIKTVLAIKNKLIPPSLNYKDPNPQINFDETPFRVNTKITEWKLMDGIPIRAGVSSFGMGGTNAHVILEEAPVILTTNSFRSHHILPFSAKTDSSLQSMTENLKNYLIEYPDLSIADASFTLKVGRKRFDRRRVVVCKDVDSAKQSIETLDPKNVFTQSDELQNRPVVFMFPGGGAQYVNMAFGLYLSEPFFRQQVDECLRMVNQIMKFDLKTFMFSDKQSSDDFSNKIEKTSIALPALFTIEYALAKLFINWGIAPKAMIGHSLGEYTAACISGVLSLQDAISLVTLRGKLFEKLPDGAMLSVPLSEKDIYPLLIKGLSIAAINAPSLSVVSGAYELIDLMEKNLTEKGLETRKLHISVAAHSEMVEPILAEFETYVKKLKPGVPRIPYVSNVTGTWITDKEALDPTYWVRHIRQTVRFAEGISNIIMDKETALLEVGPGQTLNIFSRQHPEVGKDRIILTSLRHPYEEQTDEEFIQKTLAKLWLSGVEIDWNKFYEGERRKRISLPSYVFDKQKHWVEYQGKTRYGDLSYSKQGRKEFSNWFYVPTWKRIPIQSTEDQKLRNERWLVFMDETGVGNKLIENAKQTGVEVISVFIGDNYEPTDNTSFTINPKQSVHFQYIFKELIKLNKIPDRIIHLWGIDQTGNDLAKLEWLNFTQELEFLSLLFIAQAITEQNVSRNIKLYTVTNNVHSVTGRESLYPGKALVLGPTRVLPKEYPNISSCNIDISLNQSSLIPDDDTISKLFDEMTAEILDPVVALRGQYRWVQGFEAAKLKFKTGNKRLRKNGVYLITGGLGGVGLTIAEYLAKNFQAKLILTGRSEFPAKELWDSWKFSHQDESSKIAKIQKLQSIENSGGELLVISADVSNPDDMKKVILEAEKKFGNLNGIIHSAGIINDGISQLKSVETAEQVLNPKVKGTIILKNLTEGKNLDFFAVFSSLNAVLAPAGQIDYCAANNFLDTFAQSDVNKNDSFVVSIGWPGWKEVGLAAKISTDQNARKGREELLIQKGISPEEGAEVFRIIMENDFNYVAVSTYDLNSEIEQYSRLKSIENIVNNEFQNVDDVQTSINDPIEPMNQIEETIAVVWKDMIGIEKVKLNDNFFEIGGHSLLATQIISRLREDFQLDLSIKDIFSAPTIAQFAKIIEGKILEEIKSQTD